MISVNLPRFLCDLIALCRSLGALACTVAFLTGCEPDVTSAQGARTDVGMNNYPLCDNRTLFDSFANGRSDVQVLGCGEVVKVLPDDKKGSRHQRLVVRLDGSKQTVLIAHNIDLAPRVADAVVGDELHFYGEYEYNSQGGVVHWTHKDPAGRHQDGWIDKDGTRYQ